MTAGNMRTAGPITAAPKPQRASASTKRANPRDFTGLQKQKLEAEKATEIADRASEIATMNAAKAKVMTEEIVDYTQGGTGGPGKAPEISESDVELEVEPATVVIRVNAPIDDMVFGRTIDDMGDPARGIPASVGGLNFYSFEEGVKYEVPYALARHLDELGYLWH